MSPSALVIETDPTPDQIQYLEDRLYEFNSTTTGIADGQGLAIFVRDEQDRVVAGICGHTWGGCCEIRQFWVDESRRRQGLGTRLLSAAEQEARRRRCQQIVLTTFDFQAPAFYVKHGFHRLAAVEGYPRDHQSLLLQKDLVGPPPDQLAAVRPGYDRWALVYDHDANPLPALEEPHVRDAVGDVDGLTVLDLGCGTGRHAAWLAAAGARVTAVDFSEGMLAVARRRTEGASVRLLVHDLHQALPFPNESFDLVVSGLVLEHLRDLAAFFGEAHRVLRRRGRAVVSAMHPAMFLRDSQARFTDPASGAIVQPGSLPHRLGDFVMAAVRAGFTLESIGEYAPDARFATQYPRAEKYVGWPMLVVMRMRVAVTVPSATA